MRLIALRSALTLLLLPVALPAQQSATPMRASSHHDAVTSRGDHAMGFSHETTTHHFRLYKSGGAIDVSANDPKDSATRNQIRMHLSHIAKRFAAGNFHLAMFIHATTTPSAPLTANLRTQTHYLYSHTPRDPNIKISRPTAPRSTRAPPPRKRLSGCSQVRHPAHVSPRAPAHLRAGFSYFLGRGMERSPAKFSSAQGESILRLHPYQPASRPARRIQRLWPADRPRRASRQHHAHESRSGNHGRRLGHPSALAASNLLRHAALRNRDYPLFRFPSARSHRYAGWRRVLSSFLRVSRRHQPQHLLRRDAVPRFRWVPRLYRRLRRAHFDHFS